MEIMEDLRPRIDQLQDMQGDNLSGAMKDLQKALLENPSAVSLLLPEDIGKMVEALRRMTGQAIAAAATPKKKSDKPKALTAEEMASAFDEL